MVTKLTPYVTVHRILATLVMTRARHVRTVRQKMQELTRNDRVRILLIKNVLCVRQHGRNNSLCAGKLLTRIPCQLRHAHRAGTCSSTVSCKSNQSEFRQNLPKLCDISKKANFRRYFDAPIVPISLKFCSNVPNFTWHFVLRTTKFCATVYLGSEIPWNISFVGVEIKLNVLRRTIFKRSSVHVDF